MAITVENVEKAIQEFYGGTDAHGEAHQWLTSAKVSSEAWNFCWDLINPSKPYEVQFFGASTLQAKITHYWHELSADQYLILRKKLLDYIAAYATGPRPVLKRLCIVLSTFMIRIISEHPGEVITDIIQAFQPQNAPDMPRDQAIGVLTEILTVLPEEFEHMLLAHSYRGVVRNELRSAAVQVIPILEQVMSSCYAPEVHLQAIRCLSSWIQFDVPLPDLQLLLGYVLEAVKDDFLFEVSLDCLANVACYPDALKYPTALQKLLGDLLGLEPLLNKCLAEKDLDKCYYIYNLFTTVAETYCTLLLTCVEQKGPAKENALRIINLILQCTATAGLYPVEETCSSLVFNFWYLLQDELVSSEPEKYTAYAFCFLPIYTSLVDILMTKSVYPSVEEYQTYNSDDKEQFRCYRQDIGDTLMYCYNVLRESLLLRLNSHLDAVLQKIDAGDSTAMKFLEACLFAFESVAESVDFEESTCLSKLFARLPTIPFSDSRVVTTALSTIGAYAEWIRGHPDVLTHIIPLLLVGLKDKDMAPASTRALKEITRDCQQHMGPFALQILTESQTAINNNIIYSNESIRLMCTVGNVLSILSLPDILSYLTTILKPVMQELEQLAKVKPPSYQLLLTFRLNMLAMLFANLDVRPSDNRDEVDDSEHRSEEEHSARRKRPLQDSSQPTAREKRPQPLSVILPQLLPVISRVATAWRDDPVAIELICEVLKKAVSTLLDEIRPAMPDILSLMVDLYRVHPRVAILDLTKQFLLLFGKEEEHMPMLRAVFAEIVNITLMVCEKGVAEQTDILQGFLQVLAQVLKKVPIFLVDQNINLTLLFACGVLGLSLPEAPTVKAASSFLVTFINQSQEVPSMLEVVNTHGEALTMRTMRCIGGEAPRGVIDLMADILHVLNKKFFSQLCQWMNSYMLHDNCPSGEMDKMTKEHYIRLILKERVNKRKLQETVKEFSLMCRGLLGTAYGTEIMPFL